MPNRTQPTPEEIAAEQLHRFLEAGAECEVPADAATAADHRNPRRRREQPAEQPEVGIIVQPEARHDLDTLVLHPEAKADIIAGLRAIEMRPELERVWNI